MTDEVRSVLMLALDALIWCSGSQDFGPGGIASAGWRAPGGPETVIERIYDLLPHIGLEA